MSQPRAACLILGWGNSGRGDDALGLECVALLRERIPSDWMDRVELLEDHQLQIEHVMDLLGRQRVLLIDASTSGHAPFEVSFPTALRDGSYSSHALTPEALLQVFTDVYGHSPPPTTLLALKGVSFGLGDGLSPQARAHLGAACAWALRWCERDAPGEKLCT